MLGCASAYREAIKKQPPNAKQFKNEQQISSRKNEAVRGEALHVLWRWRALSSLICASLAAGCSGMGDTTVGGRPIVYKNAPGDEVEVKAGIVRKADTAEAPAPAPAPVPRAAPQAAPKRDTVAAAAPSTRAPAATLDADVGSRYTQAARYGDMLFLSGQIANDMRTGAFDDKQDIEAQTRHALDNVRAILEANRLTMANIVQVTVYITNISRLSGMDNAYHEYFRGNPPARTVVEVSNLPRGALVEITVVAGR
jgi:2-iminobutanoate/2-iminopropanoate deaminase